MKKEVTSKVCVNKDVATIQRIVQLSKPVYEKHRLTVDPLFGVFTDLISTFYC